MLEELKNLFYFGHYSKIATTQVIHCKQCSDENVDVIIIIFNDGYTDVRCPFDRVKKSCFYQVNTPRVEKWYKPVLLILLLLAFAVAITFFTSWLKPILTDSVSTDTSDTTISY